MTKILCIIIGIVTLYSGVMTWVHNQHHRQWTETLNVWQDRLYQTEQALDAQSIQKHTCEDRVHALHVREIDLAACQEHNQSMQQVIESMIDRRSL